LETVRENAQRPPPAGSGFQVSESSWTDAPVPEVSVFKRGRAATVSTVPGKGSAVPSGLAAFTPFTVMVFASFAK